MREGVGVMVKPKGESLPTSTEDCNSAVGQEHILHEIKVLGSNIQKDCSDLLQKLSMVDFDPGAVVGDTGASHDSSNLRAAAAPAVLSTTSGSLVASASSGLGPGKQAHVVISSPRQLQGSARRTMSSPLQRAPVSSSSLQPATQCSSPRAAADTSPIKVIHRADSSGPLTFGKSMSTSHFVQSHHHLAKQSAISETSAASDDFTVKTIPLKGPASLNRPSMLPGLVDDDDLAQLQGRLKPSSPGAHGTTSFGLASSAMRQSVEIKAVEYRSGRARLTLGREKARNEKKERQISEFRLPLEAKSVAEFIQTRFFDNLVGLIILFNAVVIGVQTDYNAKYHPNEDEVPLIFVILENFFAAWFTLELSLRIHVYRFAFFDPRGEQWGWNYFDAFVVVAQLVELVFQIVATSASVDASSFRALRVLRVLRLVRILRVVRVLHLITELRAIVSSIMGSFRSLGWVVVLLLLMMYIVAVFFTQSITDHLIDRKQDAVNFKLSTHEETLSAYFPSLPRSILSLWQSISGGLDWDVLVWPLFNEISFITGVAFAGFIAFSLLALLNVVTGVFVQTALLSARKEEDLFMSSQIVELLSVSDVHDELISWEDVLEKLEDPKLAKEWGSIGLGLEDARFLFKLLDTENCGSISFEEFMGGCLRMTGDAKAIDLLTVMQESRKSEEVFRGKFDDIVLATADLLEQLEKVSADVRQVVALKTDFESTQRGLETTRCDIAILMETVTREFSYMRKALTPLSHLKDALMVVSSNEPYESV